MGFSLVMARVTDLAAVTHGRIIATGIADLRAATQSRSSVGLVSTGR
jgi:hypothetical protein